MPPRTFKISNTKLGGYEKFKNIAEGEDFNSYFVSDIISWLSFLAENRQCFDRKPLEDNQFSETLSIYINNNCTHIFENISMYPPSTLYLTANHNQQNILDGITPVLPSIFVTKFNTSNHYRGNFNSDNSNRSGRIGGRGYPR